MLTLEEAIKHCLEVAENNEQFAQGKWIGAEGEANRQDCLECAKDHRQLAEWLTELREAKRLLKVAVEDFSYYEELCCYYNTGCGICVDCNAIPCNEFRWRYADEAEKLLKED